MMPHLFYFAVLGWIFLFLIFVGKEDKAKDKAKDPKKKRPRAPTFKCCNEGRAGRCLDDVNKC